MLTRHTDYYSLQVIWRWCMVVLLALFNLVPSSLADINYPCDNPVYCYGDLLHTIQMAHLFSDSKTFVDMKMKYTINETLYKFKQFMEETNSPSRLQLATFVNHTFDPAGSEFEDWTPDDWKQYPKFLDSISDHLYKNWAYDLNALWKFLGRKMKDEVGQNKELYSIIYVPNPVIVPGGRFREFYYWDSYWIVRGLLLSEMYHTVKGMLENFLHIVETYGHIPNGGRVYYLERSQPPMLLPMVEDYIKVTKDIQFLKKSLPTLEKEFSYWMTNHTVLVEKDGKNYTLARYMDRSQGPRPESYREDYELLNDLPEKEKNQHYSELKAAAESGWDFSTRWFINNATNKGTLADLKAMSIIPVDLNAFIYWNAKLLAEFNKMVGNTEKSWYFQQKADEWIEAVTEVLWHEEVGAWLDYDIQNELKRDYFYPTNIAPLWTGCYDISKKDDIVNRVMKYLENSQMMVNLGGIPTSFEHSGEQWDYPNAWPPLQHMMVVGLYNTGDVWAQELAYEISNRWVRSNYRAYNETHAMYEKYDATIVGGHGGGGEYDVQLGFGWTNGVVLDFLHMFGDKLTYHDDFEEGISAALIKDEETPTRKQQVNNSSTSSGLLAPLIITAVILLGLVVGGSIWYKKTQEEPQQTGSRDIYRRFYRGTEYQELRNLNYEQ